MRSREENLSRELLIHIFYLITEKHANTKKRWTLIDEIPQKFLENGVLKLNDIDFFIFGYKISHVDFRHCIFNHCSFSHQIFIDCDFINSIFNSTEFIECAMECNHPQLPFMMACKLNSYTIPGIRYFYMNEIPEIQRESCRQWALNFSESNDSAWQIFGNDKKRLIHFYFDQQKIFNHQYDSILVNPAHGFYMLCTFGKFIPKKTLADWKLHLSVEKNSIKKAYNCIAPILLEHSDIFNFKVSDINFKFRTTRFRNCAQFTIYFFHLNLDPFASENKLKNILQKMVDTLKAEGIQEGEIPESDCKTIFPYFSLRNDGNNVIRYLSSNSTAKNHNPYNLPSILDYLLPEKPMHFAIENHFNLFNHDTDERIATAFYASIFALINNHLKPECVYQLYTKDRYKKFFHLTTYPDYSSVLQEELSPLMKENPDDSDLFTLRYLLKKCVLFMKNSNDIIDSAKSLIHFFNRALLTGGNSSDSISWYCFKQSIALSTKNKLLNDLMKLISFMPSSFHQHQSDNSYINKFYAFYPAQDKNKSVNDENDFQLFLSYVNIGIEEWLEFDEEKQALLLANPKNTEQLFKLGITPAQCKTIRLDVLSVLLEKLGNILEFCKSAKLSLEDFINLDIKAIMMISISPDRVILALSFLNITLKQFLSMPIHKCIFFLKQYLNKHEKLVACSFETLIEFDDGFILKLLNHQLLSNSQWREEMIVKLSMQSHPIREFWLHHARYLPHLFNNASPDLTLLYHMKQWFRHMSDLVYQLPVIVKQFEISCIELMEKPMELKIALCKNPKAVLAFLQHFRICLNDILSLKTPLGHEIILFAEELYLTAKKGNLSLPETLSRLEKIKFSDLTQNTNTCRKS